MTEIEELERLLEKATPGPWTVELYGDVGSDSLVIHSDADNRVCFMATPGDHSDREAIASNACLITAMRNALPRLLSALKHSRSERAMALEEAAKVADEYGLKATSFSVDRQRGMELAASAIAMSIRALSPASEGGSSAAQGKCAPEKQCHPNDPHCIWPECSSAAQVPPPLPSTAGWLPISTAPKDGTEIMLYAPVQMYDGKPTPERVTVGHWTQEEECRIDVGDCGGPCRCREYDYVDPSWLSWDGGFTEQNPPTKWMPMPFPPAPSQEGASEGEGEEK